MEFITQYLDEKKYGINGVIIDDDRKEIEFYVTETNEAQKSIPQMINGYTIIILKELPPPI